MNSTCPVCGDPLVEPNVAICQRCGKDFHLQTRMDVEGKDCGRVWIGGPLMEVQYACQNCLDARAAAARGEV